MVIAALSALMATLSALMAAVVMHAGPAAASPVKLTASATSVRAGAPVILSGTVLSERLTHTHLQRRTRSGTWRTVVVAKVAADRTYSVTVTPPVGVQHYRALTRVQDGSLRRNLSRTVEIAVLRPPGLVVHHRAGRDSWGRAVQEIWGSLAERETALRLQRREKGEIGWATVESLPVIDGTFRTSVRDVRTAQFRVVAPATSTSSRAVSHVIGNAHARYQLGYDEPLTLTGLFPEQRAAVVEIELGRGMPLTLLGTGPDGTSYQASVFGPRGGEVGTFSHLPEKRALRFTARADGVYTIKVDQVEGTAWTMWALTTPVAETTVDGPAVLVDPNHRAAGLALFHGRAGQLVTVAGRPWEEVMHTVVYGPYGERVGSSSPHEFAWPDDLEAHQLPSSGYYLAGMGLGRSQQMSMELLEAHSVRLSLDGSSTVLSTDRSMRTVIGEIVTAPGQRVRLTLDSVQPTTAGRVITVVTHDGQVSSLYEDDPEDVLLPAGRGWVSITLDEPGSVTISADVLPSE